MNRRTGMRLVVGCVAAVIVVGATYGWRDMAARRAWRDMRPERPAQVGARAPGLDARLDACEVRLQAYPPDHAALVEFALLCHANGQFDAAMRAYAALGRFEPDEGRWPMLHAAIHASYGRLAEALPLLRRAVDRSPGHVPAWLRLGDVLLKADNIPGASAAYDEALRRDPENGYALLGLARCALDEERWTAARALLQRAVAADPRFAPAHHLLSTVYERLGNAEAAAAALARADSAAMQVEPADPWIDELIAFNHDIYRLRVAAATAMSAGNLERALAICDRAKTLAPSDGRVFWQYGKIYSRAGRLPEARESLERSVELDPGNEKALIDLMNTVRLMGDTTALAALEDVFQRRFGPLPQ